MLALMFPILIDAELSWLPILVPVLIAAGCADGKMLAMTSIDAFCTAGMDASRPWVKYEEKSGSFDSGPSNAGLCGKKFQMVLKTSPIALLTDPAADCIP